jgi:hypothetical protein
MPSFGVPHRRYVVTAADFLRTEVKANAHVVAWSRRAGQNDPPTVVDIAAVPMSDLRLPLPAVVSGDSNSWGNFTLWHTAEVSCDGAGWALLGEVRKVRMCVCVCVCVCVRVRVCLRVRCARACVTC